jgi:hypothetical protein
MLGHLMKKTGLLGLKGHLGKYRQAVEFLTLAQGNVSLRNFALI